MDQSTEIPALRRVLSLPELTDLFLCFLSVNDLNSLRLVDRRFHRSCTPRWCLRSLEPLQHCGLSPDTCQDLDHWRAWTESILDRVNPLLVGSVECWSVATMETLGRKAVESCPNMSSLSFRGITAMPGRGQCDQEMATMKSLIQAMGHRLRHLGFRIKPWAHAFRSDQMDETARKEHARVTRIDELLESLKDFASARSLLPPPPQDSLPPLSGLVSLHIDRARGGTLRTLELGTLLSVIQVLPGLQELHIGPYRITEGTEDEKEMGREGRSENLHLESDRQPWQHRALRKLTIMAGLTPRIAHNMAPWFPELIELTVGNLGCFWLPPVELMLSSQTRSLSPPTPWAPFPKLQRFTVPITSPEFGNYILAGTAFPKSLRHVSLMTNNCILREQVSRLENQIQLHPESVLESLTLNDRDHGMFISFLTQNCCARLRYLKLTDGCWVLAQMLLLERAHPTDPAMPITRESPSVSWNHLTPDFVQSRIRCASTLRSLTLGTHDGGIFLSTHFVNRLLRCLPELQEFTMEDSVSDLRALTSGLGRYRHRNRRQTEKQMGSGSTRRDTGDGTRAGEEETEEDEEDERPLLRSLSLRVSTSVDRPREEQLLREKFRLLESVNLISMESDPVDIAIGLFD